MTPFASDAVQAAFEAVPHGDRDGLLALRELIFDVAVTLDEVLTVKEDLRWF